MFLDFFYLLRTRGLAVSLNEWLALLEALDRGLCESSLLNFYHLCRSVLIKSESDYDKFDMVFAEYFQCIEFESDLPEEFWQWLHKDIRVRDIDDKTMLDDCLLELEELMQRFRERIEEQKERHDGGNYWIGTGGTSTMGHSGYHERGIRTGGESRHKTAVQVAGERHFRDFRQDNVLDIRNFQMALRKLRQYSSRVEGAKTELDIDETIDETCDNAGNLKLVFKKPRKNTVKLLLLFDSDGSMLPYGELCSQLFQAVSKSNHFKDIRVYYFHNCVYDYLYTTPRCRRGDWISTRWALNALDSEYKVIFVGDAAMAPSELMSRGGNATIGLFNEEPGVEWLTKFQKRFKKVIWLNPIRERDWTYTYGRHTLYQVKDMFPMFELTIDGLEKGIKKLLVK